MSEEGQKTAEAEKRLHRCCFSGHRPEKLDLPEQALEWLKKEMDALEADPEEPLVEKISTDWVRLNLRAAKARGKTAEEHCRHRGAGSGQIC